MKRDLIHSNRRVASRFNFIDDNSTTGLAVLFLLLSFIIFRTDLAPIPGVVIQIPKSEKVTFHDQTLPLLLVVDSQGRFFFRHQLMNKEKLLVNLSKIRHVINSNTPLVVRAEQSLSLDKLMHVYDICMHANISNLILEVSESKPLK